MLKLSGITKSYDGLPVLSDLSLTPAWPGRPGCLGTGTDGDPAGNYWSHHSLIVVAVAME